MPLRDIVGHTRVKTLLSGAVARHSVPPTLLFVGPRGVGKSLVAQSTAAALNCQSPVRGAGELPVDACGKCRACDRIARGVHVDVLQLEPDDTGKIKVDAVRDVLERTGFRPFEGKRRVVIIRAADTLLEQAQNALLKSLEEPPPGTIFILTTAVPGALLATVRSRCMRLQFGRLTEEQVAMLLERDHGLDVGEAREAAALSDGSVGQALAFASTDVAVLRDAALQLLQQAVRGTAIATRVQAGSALALSGKKERTREEITLILRIVASLLRDIELLKSGGDARALANLAVSDELEALQRAFSGDRARDAFGAVDSAMEALERNAGTKVVSEWLAAQL